MRRLPFAIRLVCLFCLPCLPLAAGAAHAEEKKAPFHFGLESRLTEAPPSQSSDVNWGVIPNFSYHLTERFRLDAFAGVGYSEVDGLFLSLQPGFRYYLAPPRGKYRFNTGLSVGFTVIDQDQPENAPTSNEYSQAPSSDNDGLWLRAVPIEVEYWGTKRWGLTMALDYQSRLGSDRGADQDGFGLAAGFRFKIR